MTTSVACSVSLSRCHLVSVTPQRKTCACSKLLPKSLPRDHPRTMLNQCSVSMELPILVFCHQLLSLASCCRGWLCLVWTRSPFLLTAQQVFILWACPVLSTCLSLPGPFCIISVVFLLWIRLIEHLCTCFCVVGMLSLLLGLYLGVELSANYVTFLKNLKLLSKVGLVLLFCQWCMEHSNTVSAFWLLSGFGSYPSRAEMIPHYR